MTNVLGTIEITNEERFALGVALEHACNCDPEQPGCVCSAHSLLTDELVLKHLVFVRRVAQAYVRGEWQV